MSLNTHYLILEANCSRLERELKGTSAQRSDATYQSDFCIMTNIIKDEPRVSVAFVKNGALTFRQTGIQPIVDGQSNLECGEFTPLPNKMQYKLKLKKLATKEIAWADCNSGNVSVIWMPRRFPFRAVMDEYLVSAVRLLGPEYSQYDAKFVTKALVQAYGPSE